MTTTTETCTLCGCSFDQRSAFNAHIKAHLKDKLTNRKKANSQAQQQQRTSPPPHAATTVSSTTTTTTTTTTPIPPSSPSHHPNSVPFHVPRPDLETLLKQVAAKANHGSVMAELAACRPVPLDTATSTSISHALTINAAPATPPLSNASSPSRSGCKPSPASPEREEEIDASAALFTNVTSMPNCGTFMQTDLSSSSSSGCPADPDDFRRDVSSILDQIERDFDANSSIRLETPPDSDTENAPHATMTILNFNQVPSIAASEIAFSSSLNSSLENATSSLSYGGGRDLLGFDEFCRRIRVPESGTSTSSQADGTQQQQQQHLQQCPMGLPVNQVKCATPVSFVPSPSHEAAVRPSSDVRVIQSPESVARVGRLSEETLAVLNKLPAEIFLSNGRAGKMIDVVKVEPGTPGHFPVAAGQPFAIINVERRPGKLVETYRAIDTGTEIRLVPDRGTILAAADGQGIDAASSLAYPLLSSAATARLSTSASSASSSPSPSLEQANTRHPIGGFTPSVVRQTDAKSLTSSPGGSRNRAVSTSSKAKSCSECTVCGKWITTKNMARHMEKHTGRKKFDCQHCGAFFLQKTKLKNHHCPQIPTAAAASAVSPSVAHPVAPRQKSSSCSKASGVAAGRGSSGKEASARCRSRSLSCVQCNEVFSNKSGLHDHLLRVHTKQAIVSVEKVKSSRQHSDDDSANNVHHVDLIIAAPDPVVGGAKMDWLELTSPVDSTSVVDDVVSESLAEMANANYFDSITDMEQDDFYSDHFF